jgi:hypothetical protein
MWIKKPTSETTNRRVFAGLSTRKPKLNCQLDNSNQGVFHAKIEPSLSLKIKKEAKTSIPPAEATDNKAAMFPCFLKKSKVTAAERSGKSKRLRATCVI